MIGNSLSQHHFPLLGALVQFGIDGVLGKTMLARRAIIVVHTQSCAAHVIYQGAGKPPGEKKKKPEMLLSTLNISTYCTLTKILKIQQKKKKKFNKNRLFACQTMSCKNRKTPEISVLGYLENHVPDALES